MSVFTHNYGFGTYAVNPNAETYDQSSVLATTLYATPCTNNMHIHGIHFTIFKSINYLIAAMEKRCPVASALYRRLRGGGTIAVKLYWNSSLSLCLGDSEF